MLLNKKGSQNTIKSNQGKKLLETFKKKVKQKILKMYEARLRDIKIQKMLNEDRESTASQEMFWVTQE